MLLCFQVISEDCFRIHGNNNQSNLFVSQTDFFGDNINEIGCNANRQSRLSVIKAHEKQNRIRSKD